MVAYLVDSKVASKEEKTAAEKVEKTVVLRAGKWVVTKEVLTVEM